MKKIAIFILILFFVYYLILINSRPCKNKNAKIYTINNKNYCLLIASRQIEWEIGLMFYKKPVDFDGMIFIFPDKKILSFWNKNTYLDLNLYWLDGEKVVGKSVLPSILKSKEVVTVNSIKKVNRVIELIN